MRLRVGRLFRLPRRPDEAAERHATWLELFFDLVFVVALSAVTGRLPDDGEPMWRELGATLGVFTVVELAWVGHAFFDTRYDPEDLPHQFLVLLSVFGAFAITLGANDLPAGDLLPIGYLAVRGTLIVMYLRVLATHRSSRDLVAVYLCGFTVSWSLWLASLGLPPHDRPRLWIAALAVDLATPWIGRRWLLRHPVHRSHLPERIAQFTIIQIGAALVSLRDAVHGPPSGRTLIAAAAALVVTTSIWWVYTTFLTSQIAIPRLASGTGYVYVHIPIGIGILFAGWALGRVVQLTSEHRQELPATLRLVLALAIVTWMLGGLATAWFAVGVPSPLRFVETGVGVAAISAVALIADPSLLLVLVAVILVGYAAAVAATIRKAAAG